MTPKPIVSTPDAEWRVEHKNRDCGTCFACCVYLGIRELKKYTGQACRHLDGTIPHERCTIYAKRPVACHTYRCVWLQGLSGDQHRPDLCGVLVTPYASEYGNELGALTMMVFDEDKAKPYLDDMIQQYLLYGITEIRVIYHQRKVGTYFLNGDIFAIKMMQVDKGDFESLNFTTDMKPIGQFVMAELPNENDDHSRQGPG